MPAHSTRTSTARAATWRTGSRSSNSACMPTARADMRCARIKFDSGFQPLPTSSWIRYDGPPSRAPNLSARRPGRFELGSSRSARSFASASAESVSPCLPRFRTKSSSLRRGTICESAFQACSDAHREDRRFNNSGYVRSKGQLTTRENLCFGAPGLHATTSSATAARDAAIRPPETGSAMSHDASGLAQRDTQAHPLPIVKSGAGRITPETAAA